MLTRTRSNVMLGVHCLSYHAMVLWYTMVLRCMVLSRCVITRTSVTVLHACVLTRSRMELYSNEVCNVSNYVQGVELSRETAVWQQRPILGSLRKNGSPSVVGHI
jgi:hypothetical protein